MLNLKTTNTGLCWILIESILNPAFIFIQFPLKCLSIIHCFKIILETMWKSLNVCKFCSYCNISFTSTCVNIIMSAKSKRDTLAKKLQIPNLCQFSDSTVTIQNLIDSQKYLYYGSSNFQGVDVRVLIKGQ